MFCTTVATGTVPVVMTAFAAGLKTTIGVGVGLGVGVGVGVGVAVGVAVGVGDVVGVGIETGSGATKYATTLFALLIVNVQVLAVPRLRQAPPHPSNPPDVSILIERVMLLPLVTEALQVPDVALQAITPEGVEITSP